MESELLQRHSTRETLEAAVAAAAGSPNTVMHNKRVVTQGRDLVNVSSCVSLRAMEDNNEDDKELSELSETEDEGEDQVYTLRQEHQHQQQATARKSLVRHAIKGINLFLLPPPLS